MLIVRAPLRISFGGGGTDLESYWSKFGGMVLSTAINRYCYVIITRGDQDGVQISSANMRMFNYRFAPGRGLVESSSQDAEVAAAYQNDTLKIPWAVCNYFGIDRGLNIFLASEVPAGTGLGSSSTLSVALVKALATLSDHTTSRYDLAEIASEIEIERIGMPIGRQDQYASAFGGLNTIQFGTELEAEYKHGSNGGSNRAGYPTHVERVEIAQDTYDQLERSLMLFFTGATHQSGDILREQKAATERNEAEVVDSLHTIKALALDMRQALQQGDLENFGRLLDTSWQHKKRLSSAISTPLIDAAYSSAVNNGAWGGKIAGAGGGGFMLLCCPPEKQPRVTAAMLRHGMERMTFRFDRKGATVLLNGGELEESFGLDFILSRLTAGGKIA